MSCPLWVGAEGAGFVLRCQIGRPGLGQNSGASPCCVLGSSLPSLSRCFLRKSISTSHRGREVREGNESESVCNQRTQTNVQVSELNLLKRPSTTCNRCLSGTPGRDAGCMPTPAPLAATPSTPEWPDSGAKAGPTPSVWLTGYFFFLISCQELKNQNMFHKNPDFWLLQITNTCFSHLIAISCNCMTAINLRWDLLCRRPHHTLYCLSGQLPLST